VKKFVSATASGQVQVSAEEAGHLPKADAIGSPAFIGFWSGALAKRAQAFSAGGLPAVPPYTVSGQKISPAEEAAGLLKAVPKINAQFKVVLNAAGLSGKSAHDAGYWEVVNTEGTAAVTLGASASTHSPGKAAQMADIQYYSSGSFYVFLTVQHLWPTTRAGKPATLIWRGDLLSAAELGRLRGIERSAAGSAMGKEIVKTISAFQKDAAR
jgi:hypothetical protein